MDDQQRMRPWVLDCLTVLFLALVMILGMHMRRVATQAIVREDLNIDGHDRPRPAFLHIIPEMLKDPDFPEELREVARIRQAKRIKSQISYLEVVPDDIDGNIRYYYMAEHGELKGPRAFVLFTGGADWIGLDAYSRWRRDLLCEIGAPADAVDPIPALKSWFKAQYGRDVSVYDDYYYDKLRELDNEERAFRKYYNLRDSSIAAQVLRQVMRRRKSVFEKRAYERP